jgi:hypothetical protein
VRIVVVVEGESDAAVASAVAAAGANVLATLSPPNADTDSACDAAGIAYLARIPARDVAALPFHPERVAAIRALRRLVALQVIDLDALEGYETPETQAFAYATLKALFPDLLVVHALRLDPIGWDPGYLERFYRPELCDVVAPYFYPVGTTYLGTYEEDDRWPALLRTLLEQVAARTDAPAAILPVLQAFEQTGHPVSRATARPPGRRLPRGLAVVERARGVLVGRRARRAAHGARRSVRTCALRSRRSSAPRRRGRAPARRRVRVRRYNPRRDRRDGRTPSST